MYSVGSEYKCYVLTYFHVLAVLLYIVVADKSDREVSVLLRTLRAAGRWRHVRVGLVVWW